MQTSTPIIDLHVHSTLKPFGNSFYNTNIKSSTDPSCLWFADQRNRSDAKVEGLLGICRFRQSDFKTLTDGQVKIAIVSLYPVEKAFFDIRKKMLQPYEVIIGEFASLFGKKRINYIRSEAFSYFKDLCDEFNYLCALDGIAIGSRKYQLLKGSSNLDTDANLIVIPSFEGCHSFSDGANPMLAESWVNMDRNVSIVKSWDSPPLFVTFAHHFYNGLCTHAKSLYETAGKWLDQEYGMRNNDFTPKDNEIPISLLGEKMIDLLLSKTNGRRILIDVKHMSLEAREAYYGIITNKYNENIPVIWSHGAVEFDQAEINMTLKKDVAMIYKTNGILGIEMDQRILGYNHNRFWKSVKRFFKPRTKAYEDAGYFWNQIITIAEFAYKNGYSDNPWKCIALGSDF